MRPTFQATEEQQAVIQSSGGAHLVIAPPGTGKTQVLIERIIWVLRTEQSSSFRVLALTFTTKAAENLRLRVQDALGNDVRRVTALTFHGFCLDVLQHYGDSVGFVTGTTVYDNDDDRLEVLARAIEEEGLPKLEDKSLRQYLTEIAILKRALTPLGAIRDPYVSTIYAAYDRVLRQYHACDFDDLLWLAWRLFTETPRVAKHYRRLYKCIVVDEAQDTSRAQYEVLRAICGEEHRNVMLVADGDQFIYSFAGASDRWLHEFVTDFGAQVHSLTANFRCASIIIDAANRLISLNPGRLNSRVMRPGTTAPGHVRALCFSDEAAEARGVADWAQTLLSLGLEPDWTHVGEERSVAMDDICILGRTRYSLEAIQREFEHRGIPHLFNVSQRGLVETAPAKLVYHGLRIVQNPADRMTKENLLAEWSRELLDEGVAELPVDQFFLRLSEVQAVEPFAAILGSHVGVPDVGTLVQQLLQALGEFDAPEEMFKALIVGDLRTLTERWNSYRGHTSPDERSISEFLGELALAGRSAVDGPGIRVLTIHAAKGLEFRAVAVVGMNEGTFPDYRNLGSEEAIAEERRGMYVAMTRASRVLLLTRAASRRMPWGDVRVQRESRLVSQTGIDMSVAPIDH